jgi:hypothetical protein
MNDIMLHAQFPSEHKQPTQTYSPWYWHCLRHVTIITATAEHWTNPSMTNLHVHQENTMKISNWQSLNLLPTFNPWYQIMTPNASDEIHEDENENPICQHFLNLTSILRLSQWHLAAYFQITEVILEQNVDPG